MTKMLVAYRPCGCRAMALLDASDREGALAFRAEAQDDGLTVRTEEHERIGAQLCGLHAMERDDAVKEE